MKLGEKLRDSRIEKLHADLLSQAMCFPKIHIGAATVEMRPSIQVSPGSFLPIMAYFSSPDGNPAWSVPSRRAWIDMFLGLTNDSLNSAGLIWNGHDSAWSEDYEGVGEIGDGYGQILAISEQTGAYLQFEPTWRLWNWRLAIIAEPLSSNTGWISESEREFEPIPGELVQNKCFQPVMKVMDQMAQSFSAAFGREPLNSFEGNFEFWIATLATVFEKRIRKTEWRLPSHPTSFEESPPLLNGWVFNLPWNFFLSSAIALERLMSSQELQADVKKWEEASQHERETLTKSGYQPKVLAKRLMIDNGTLRKYAKQCGAVIPEGKGHSNFRYGMDDVRRICEYILTSSLKSETHEGAKGILADLESAEKRQ